MLLLILLFLYLKISFILHIRKKYLNVYHIPQIRLEMNLLKLIGLAREEELKPYFEIDRPVCPFYGFNGMYGGFIETSGNQCGLVTESHSPCYMEIEGNR